MKKFTLKNLENTKLQLDTEYYIGLKRSYGYDVLDMNFNQVYGFGESIKEKFTDNINLLLINKNEKIKLYFYQLIDIIKGKYNHLRYHTFN